MTNPSAPTQPQPSTKSRLSTGLVIATGLLTAASFAGAPYPRELTLQHAPTAGALAGLGLAIRYGWLRFSSVVCVLAFLWLHIVGARWIYSFVPYDAWSEAWLGTSISEAFGWRRNHYDRLVHLASGLCLVPPAAECLRRYGGMGPRGAAVQSIAVVLAIGALYEILEWVLAVTLSPEQAEAYNGQQGDVWDPQKDLLMAAIGSSVAAVAIWLRGVSAERRKGRAEERPPDASNG